MLLARGARAAHRGGLPAGVGPAQGNRPPQLVGPDLAVATTQAHPAAPCRQTQHPAPGVKAAARGGDRAGCCSRPGHGGLHGRGRSARRRVRLVRRVGCHRCRQRLLLEGVRGEGPGAHGRLLRAQAGILSREGSVPHVRLGRAFLVRAGQGHDTAGTASGTSSGRLQLDAGAAAAAPRKPLLAGRSHRAGRGRRRRSGNHEPPHLVYHLPREGDAAAEGPAEVRQVGRKLLGHPAVREAATEGRRVLVLHPRAGRGRRRLGRGRGQRRCRCPGDHH
mmetsp:Transcript_17051/g.47268  ORF Transcript_17051/g.47268 Transcript_17051/m.47268 type:complete len:277 (+) Transcript_17051:2254-3084(+)